MTESVIMEVPVTPVTGLTGKVAQIHRQLDHKSGMAATMEPPATGCPQIAVSDSKRVPNRDPCVSTAPQCWEKVTAVHMNTK